MSILEKIFGRKKESNLVLHARRELAILREGEDEADPTERQMQDLVDKCVLDVVKTFSKQGHSGFSGAYTLGIIEKVLRFEPVTPLRGTDDEWNQVGDGHWQNNRCSRVFRDDDNAWDIEAKVFREPDGLMYTSEDSHVPVTFPYVPKTEVVDVPEDHDG